MLVHAEVQVQLVKGDVVVLLERVLVLEELLELVHEVLHELEHACYFGVFAFGGTALVGFVILQLAPNCSLEHVDLLKQHVWFELDVVPLEHA